jgi:hypothetical protein
MKKIIAVAVLALALIGSAPHLAMAICLLDVCPPPPPPSGIGNAASIGAGPWIVGGVGLSVLSVIVRAAVVSNREKRELTSEEAMNAIFLPFVWVFVPSGDPFKTVPIQPVPIPGNPNAAPEADPCQGLADEANQFLQHLKQARAAAAQVTPSTQAAARLATAENQYKALEAELAACVAAVRRERS